MRRRSARASFVGSLLVLVGLLPTCSSVQAQGVECRSSENALLLAAQAVPSATLIPCIASFPSGWTFGGSRIGSGSFRFWLDSDRAGVHAVQVTLSEACDVSHAVEVTSVSDDPGFQVYEEPISLPPRFEANRYVSFRGGCVTYEFRFFPGASATLALEANQALDFVPRSALARVARDETGLILCGADAPPCLG